MIFTIEATGNGVDNSYADLVGAATKAEAVWSADGDTSYVGNSSGSAARQAFTQTTPPDLLSVQHHYVKHRARTTAAGPWPQITGYLYLSGNRTDGTSVDLSGAYVTRTETDLARPGGGGWTLADFIAVEFGTWHTSAANGDVRLTRLWLELDGIPAPGGFISLVCSLLGSASLGAYLTMKDAVAIANAMLINSRGKLRLVPGELDNLLRDLRSWRHVVTA